MNIPPVFLVLIFGASLFAALVIFAALYSGRDDG